MVISIFVDWIVGLRGNMAKAIPAKLIEDSARELMGRAAIDIPADYRDGVKLARDREGNRLARFVLDQMLENWEIATADRRPRPGSTSRTAWRSRPTAT